MSDPVDALVLDLLEWIGPASKPYAEVMDAWRTSCPRLPVWEQANELGLIARGHDVGTGAFVAVSPEGCAFLSRHRPQAQRQKRQAACPAVSHGRPLRT